MTNETLNLGVDVVRLLLPHRPPLLLVDTLVAFHRQKRSLCAARHISANEAVFAGHFPGLHLWPGIYTIEGLGQSCNLLLVLEGMLGQRERDGGTAGDVLAVLRNLDLGFKLQPGFRPELVSPLRERLGQLAARLGVSAAVDIKFCEPVLAGSVLTYEVRWTHDVGDAVRFDVAARVGQRDVASGRMTVKTGVVRPQLEVAA